MEQKIKISVLDVDDIIQFQIEITNGFTSAALDFYAYDDVFKELARKLISFPVSIDEEIVFEIGKGDKQYAYHLLLKIFCFEKNGYSAIHIKMDNHGIPPYFEKLEFFIRTISASLNMFGTILNRWNPLIEKEIIWIAENL